MTGIVDLGGVINVGEEKVKNAKGFNQGIDLENYYKGNWYSLAKDGQVWYQSAESLKSCADGLQKYLWPKDRRRFGTKAAAADFIYGPVYMLLAGLAIETLIKGIIISQKPELVEHQKLSKELTRHDLIDLYQMAGLRVNTRRNNLLLRLQNYVENFGRYPVTKTKQDMEKLVQTRFAGQTDPDRIERLWSFLLREFHSQIS